MEEEEIDVNERVFLAAEERVDDERSLVGGDGDEEDPTAVDDDEVKLETGILCDKASEPTTNTRDHIIIIV